MFTRFEAEDLVRRFQMFVASSIPEPVWICVWVHGSVGPNWVQVSSIYRLISGEVKELRGVCFIPFTPLPPAVKRSMMLPPPCSRVWSANLECFCCLCPNSSIFIKRSCRKALTPHVNFKLWLIYFSEIFQVEQLLNLRMATSELWIIWHDRRSNKLRAAYHSNGFCLDLEVKGEVLKSCLMAVVKFRMKEAHGSLSATLSAPKHGSSG